MDSRLPECIVDRAATARDNVRGQRANDDQV